MEALVPLLTWISEEIQTLNQYLRKHVRYLDNQSYSDRILIYWFNFISFTRQ